MSKPPSNNKYIHKSFKLPKELAERLDKFVEAKMANRSMVVRMAILEYLDKHAPESKRPAKTKKS